MVLSSIISDYIVDFLFQAGSLTAVSDDSKVLNLFLEPHFHSLRLLRHPVAQADGRGKPWWVENWDSLKMFPFLPFLSIPDAKGRRRRRNRFRHNSLATVWLNTGSDVRVEYLLQVHPASASVTAASSTLDVHEIERPDSAPLEHEVVNEQPPPKKMSLQTSRPPTPNSRASPRSASASNSRPSSRPSSTQPPPQPRVRPNRNRMFETSSAMRELFGGASTSPRPTRKADTSPRPVQQESTQPSRSSTKDFSRSNDSVNDEQSLRSAVTSDSGIASCFQRIPSPPPTASGPSEVARTNILQTEGVQPGQWEDIPSTSQSTTISFHNVPNHDIAYENARRRAIGRPPPSSSFNIITHQPVGSSRISQPGPEIPKEPGRVLGSSPISNSPRRRNDQIEVGAPGPEMATDTEESASPETESVAEETLNLMNTRTADDERECPGKGDGAEREASTSRRESAARDYSNRKESVDRGECSRRESMERREGARRENGDNGEGADRRRVENGERALPTGTGDSAPPPIQPSSRFDQQAHKPLGGGFGAAGGLLVNDENRAPPTSAQILHQLRRFLLSTSEDGSGMAASASSGSGGAGANPLVIKGGQIVNDDSIFAADIYIEDGVIKQILPNLEVPEQAEIIEASGKWILPAGIDVHTEFSAGIAPDEFLVNSKAALIGGTTTVIDVVLPGINERLSEAVERVKRLADQKALVNVGLSLSLQKWNDDIKKEVDQLVREKKINSFILEMQSDSEVFEALGHLKSIGALARIYPENKDIIGLLERQNSNQNPAENYVNSRPVQLEAERIHKLCVLSQLTNSPISILSTSSSDACKSVVSGKRDGASVFAEIPVSTLAADLNIPIPSQGRIPIRKGEEHAREALELLANGQLAVCVSGHRTPRQSGNRPPYGVISVGERLPALWERGVASGKLDLMRFVAVTSSNAAKVFNLYPRKGRIAVGADADIAIWNAQTTKSLGCRESTSTDKSPFDGFTVHSTPEVTVCNGQVLYKNGRIEAERPSSPRFIPLPSDSPYIFSVVKLREKTFSLASPEEKKEIKNGQGPSMFENHLSNQIPEKKRSTTKVIQPPGGRSSIF
ncbi:unnamed protein product [Bursaphelenchus xylophilus]|uniref:(pine wood nematode) hypothetical protein n=1 Tax=Bursaphelenchus xylophilus TaxID=6326 RepID=A0A1I7S478_BURXY|nr:unnamed protein product [Bursaphelenchus xylophilus]CAG9116810.1 unnamed protein product [Bursaphelenchus xylophilus]